SRSQALLGNASGEALLPFQRLRPRRDGKRSFPACVPKQSLGTRGREDRFGYLSYGGQGRPMPYRSLCGSMGLLLVVLAGCGRPAGTSLAGVKGRVFYRGRPLPGGTIVFTPDPERGGHGPQACAEIGPDGCY